MWNWMSQALPLLWKIRKLGKEKLVWPINLPTAITKVQAPYLDKIDSQADHDGESWVFRGQSFIHECVSKIQQADARKRREKKLNYRIEVDGGINKGHAWSGMRRGRGRTRLWRARRCSRQEKHEGGGGRKMRWRWRMTTTRLPDDFEGAKSKDISPEASEGSFEFMK